MFQHSVNRSENISIIINAEEFGWYTVASVGAMVIVILCMKFLALHMVLLPRMAGANSSFYFASTLLVLTNTDMWLEKLSNTAISKY